MNSTSKQRIPIAVLVAIITVSGSICVAIVNKIDFSAFSKQELSVTSSADTTPTEINSDHISTPQLSNRQSNDAALRLLTIRTIQLNSRGYFLDSFLLEKIKLVGNEYIVDSNFSTVTLTSITSPSITSPYHLFAIAESTGREKEHMLDLQSLPLLDQVIFSAVLKPGIKFQMLNVFCRNDNRNQLLYIEIIPSESTDMINADPDIGPPPPPNIDDAGSES